jgi:hypothetical protein
LRSSPVDCASLPTFSRRTAATGLRPITSSFTA